MTEVDYNSAMYRREIRISKNDMKPFEMSIELKDWDGEPDCRIGNFAKNFWLRTNYGVRKKKYISEACLEMAVEQLLKKRGYKILGWRDRT